MGALHVEIELEMTWIACIKRLEVSDMTLHFRLKISDMTWLLVEDDADVLHVKIELEMTCIACIKRLKVSGMIWLLVD